MKIRLTGRWGSRLPGTVISVSDSRARYLQDELKIGRIVVYENGKPSIAEVSRQMDEEMAVEEKAKAEPKKNVRQKKG